MGNQSSSANSISRRFQAVTHPSNGTSFEHKEDVMLIWLDRSIDANRTNLRTIIHDVLLFTDLPHCLQKIRSMANERIFLIVSGEYAEECLKVVHSLSQIDSVFVFCVKVEKYRSLLLNDDRYGKIVGIFNNENELLQSIRREMNDLHQQLATFSLYEKQKPTRDLSKESASFLWFQLFKDVLLRMPRSEEARRQMIDQCRQYYRGNLEELREIDLFDQTYTDADTIHWYTKQCFVYRLCNKALRTEDVELLYIFRYYIQDLCKRLAFEYDKYRQGEQTYPPIRRLYRGLKLTKDELHRFQSNVGSLISTNGFLSTTRNMALAQCFALKTSKRNVDLHPTLFIIDVDPYLNDVIYADISALSVFPDEEEVLFDLGCAFKITDVSYDSLKRLWMIEMKLTDEARSIVETYLEANRREMEKGNVLLLFGVLLTEMGEYRQAQIYFENLLDSKTVDDLPSIYTNLGRVKFLKGQFQEALTDFQIVYDLQQKEHPINELDLARTMNNLGLTYMEEKNYEIALNYLTHVRNIYEQHLDADRYLLANALNSIGVIYIHQKNYQPALKYLSDARVLFEQSLPTIEHQTMAMNYNSLSLAYYYIEDYDSALNYCLKGWKIREKILLDNHPHLAESFNNLGLIYQKLKDYAQALSFFQRALDIYQNTSDLKQRVPICWNNLGLMYLDQGDANQAIHYHQQALQFYQEDPKSSKDDLALTWFYLGMAFELKGDEKKALKAYHHALEFSSNQSEEFVRILGKLGHIYQQQGNQQQALQYYHQALDHCPPTSFELLSSLLMSLGLIYHREGQYPLALGYYKRLLAEQKQHLTSNHRDLAWTYNNLGCLYDDMNDIHRAMKYQEKALNIRRAHLAEDHPDLATSLNNLGRIYQRLTDYDRALDYYRSALQIRRRSLPADHPDLAHSYYNLGLIYLDQANPHQAEKYLQHTLEIQKKIFPDQHPDLQKTMQLLVGAGLAQNKMH